MSRRAPTTSGCCRTPDKRSMTLLEACERYAEKDDRVSIERYEDLVYPGLTMHAFYVKYLLPIYFDVQSHGAFVGPTHGRRAGPGRDGDVHLGRVADGLHGEVARAGLRGDLSVLSPPRTTRSGSAATPR